MPTTPGWLYDGATAPTWRYRETPRGRTPGDGRQDRRRFGQKRDRPDVQGRQVRRGVALANDGVPPDRAPEMVYNDWRTWDAEAHPPIRITMGVGGNVTTPIKGGYINDPHSRIGPKKKSGSQGFAWAHGASRDIYRRSRALSAAIFTVSCVYDVGFGVLISDVLRQREPLLHLYAGLGALSDPITRGGAANTISASRYNCARRNMEGDDSSIADVTVLPTGHIGYSGNPL